MRESSGNTRRSFLKLSGVLALSASLDLPAGATVEKSSKASHAAPGHHTHESGLIHLADPMQGTNSTPLFSRGNTLPIVAAPFGMAHWALQSSDSSPWFFQPNDLRLQGLRCTHQLSPWIGDYGYVTFLPFCGQPSPDASSRASSYRADDLKLSPHFLKVHLTRYRCIFELVPTERCSKMRFTFQDSGPAGVFLDIPGKECDVHCDSSNGTITALTRDNRGGFPAGFAAYYVAKVDTQITGFEVKEIDGHKVAIVGFAAQAGKAISFRVGTSFISFEQATRNLSQEIGPKTFEQLLGETGEKWEEVLGRAHIQGGTEAQRKVFYSALYRASLFPRIWHEIDASGNVVHFSVYSGSVEPGVMYADHGFWDDYRSWYPMMTLLYPERLAEILQAWVNAFKEGGWLPQFPCPGYRGAMTGSLIDSVFGDAAAKDLKGFDLQTAYLGLKKHATQKGKPGFGYGRQALEEYLKLGYVPCDQVGGAVVETLDSAYGDFCIAQVARALGKHEDAEMFEKRSKNWRNLFDPKVKFLRGKLSNGSWLEPFEPHTWGGSYVEGSAWQYRFSVPHDPSGLMDAMGGKATFVGFLEEMLTQAPIFHVGSYGQEIHEMSEMAAVNFGQYAHSNQPVHHVLYLFTIAGRRDRTQYWVHRVLNELYSPENFPGDEDTGSMSSWYVLSALGIFSMCPGTPDWVLGAPLFEQAEIRLPDGPKIRITANRKKPEAYYGRILLNGKVHDGASVPHFVLRKGALLSFTAS